MVGGGGARYAAAAGASAAAAAIVAIITSMSAAHRPAEQVTLSLAATACKKVPRCSSCSMPSATSPG